MHIHVYNAEDDVKSRETLWWRQQLQRQCTRSNGQKETVENEKMCDCIWKRLQIHRHRNSTTIHSMNAIFGILLNGKLGLLGMCVCVSERWLYKCKRVREHATRYVYTYVQSKTHIGLFVVSFSYVLKKSLCRLLDCCSQINSVVLKRISTVTNGKESRYKTRRGNETLLFFVLVLLYLYASVHLPKKGQFYLLKLFFLKYLKKKTVFRFGIFSRKKNLV